MQGAIEAAPLRAGESVVTESLSSVARASNETVKDVQKVLAEVAHREVVVEERIAFPYMQAVAPMNGEEWPQRRDFFAAQFRDLSQHGFSFLVATPPQAKRLAVELGWQPCCYCFVAQVVNCTPEHLADGRQVYRVGCKFTRRVKT